MEEAAAAQQGSAIRVLLPPPHFPTNPPVRHSECSDSEMRNLKQKTCPTPKKTIDYLCE